MDDSLFRQVMGPTLAPRGPKGKVKGKGNKHFEPAVPVQQPQPVVSNRALTEENALLVQLLQQAKAEREQLLMDVATLKKRVLEKEITVVEQETRRTLEVNAFRAALQKERIKFDDKLVAVQKTVLARDKLVVDMVEICSSYSILSPNAAVKATIEKACWQVPQAKEAAVAIFRRYVSDAGGIAPDCLASLGLGAGSYAGEEDEYDEEDDYEEREEQEGARVEARARRYTRRQGEAAEVPEVEDEDAEVGGDERSRSRQSSPVPPPSSPPGAKPWSLGRIVRGMLSTAMSKVSAAPGPQPPSPSSPSSSSLSAAAATPAPAPAPAHAPTPSSVQSYKDDFEKEEESGSDSDSGDGDGKAKTKAKAKEKAKAKAKKKNNKKEKKKKRKESDSDSDSQSDSD